MTTIPTPDIPTTEQLEKMSDVDVFAIHTKLVDWGNAMLISGRWPLPEHSKWVESYRHVTRHSKDRRLEQFRAADKQDAT